MHEMSIAMSLLDVITQRLIEAEVDDAAAKKVTVDIGALCGVVPAALRSAFVVAVRGTSLASCMLCINEIDIVHACAQCKKNAPVMGVNDLRCTFCGTPAQHIVRGRELDLISIELEPHAATHS
jgi:hydrogenase nickel incorporation protein HypA/HybF